MVILVADLVCISAASQYITRMFGCRLINSVSHLRSTSCLQVHLLVDLGHPVTSGCPQASRLVGPLRPTGLFQTLWPQWILATSGEDLLAAWVAPLTLRLPAA